MADPSSLRAFSAAQRRAFIQDALADMSGRSGDLLPSEEVSRQLHLSEPAGQVKLEEIALNKVVGSVGRYQDFNRAFLPRGHLDPARWIRIDQLRALRGLPPIDVFRVGDVYFVRDGHHRVSVARARGQKIIKAHVIDIPVRVPLGPDTRTEDLLLKAGYAQFLEQTCLDQANPDLDIQLTQPGGYQKLLVHLEVYRFYKGLRSQHYPSLPETAADWYRGVYLPVVERIRSCGILARFPRRTEADLYLWIAENRARLQMQYCASAEARRAVESFSREHRALRIVRWIRHLRSRYLRPRKGLTPS